MGEAKQAAEVQAGLWVCHFWQRLHMHRLQQLQHGSQIVFPFHTGLQYAPCGGSCSGAVPALNLSPEDGRVLC